MQTTTQNRETERTWHPISKDDKAAMTARVVVDGNLISAAGVTAGLDAALALVSLFRGDAAAQEIQLAIEYAPNPIFRSGTPESATAEVLERFQKKYEPIGREREAEAILHAGEINIGRLCDEFPAKRNSHDIRDGTGSQIVNWRTQS